MTDKLTATKTCPKCDSPDYMFRARKAIDPEPGRERGAVETKYRCKACGTEWTVRVPPSN